MSFEIRYEGDTAAKEAKALADCKDWLGEAQYKRVLRVLQQGAAEGVPKGMLVHALALQGIQGYPAWVMVTHAVEHVAKISGELSPPAVV